MTNKVELEFAAKTDTGLLRSQNEDSVALSPAYGFALLADGMGGYNAGEVASNMATTIAKAALEEGMDTLQHSNARSPEQLHRLIVESVQRTNNTILDAARNEPQYAGMGTTLVAAVFHEDKVMLAHVGDSRAYLLRDGTLTQLTRDHSVLQEQIDAGLISAEWAHYAQNKNLVTRAVGVSANVEVDIHEHVTQAGDIFMLCSDGLSDMLRSEEIQESLIRQRHSLQTACDILVQEANEAGGHDNISVVLVQVGANSTCASSLLDRILGWVN
ncbi:MAG TPA: Stp1/IreP family PP2C-type Ser/Thr phosphatase [Noviherbaspirillum sp.]|nr:Stp1/IreP family PP2C-type Ser/Thr phosphatase [Noviherbaspirillum sp.]